ncbi:hypothetical protein AB1L88_11685 [Tautonia sp. JC769]|uniref:hypothetical protein n=1 Tax=Tautonia sp. JC769 TaxID=3232135 RepID=UPI00345AC5E5
MNHGEESNSAEMEACLIYRAAYRLVADARDGGADRARFGRRLPPTVEEYAIRRGWDRSPEAMELLRQGAEDASEGRRPAY